MIHMVLSRKSLTIGYLSLWVTECTRRNRRKWCVVGVQTLEFMRHRWKIAKYGKDSDLPYLV